MGGIFLNLTHECDDNNRDDGDGCSSTCSIEYGFACEQGKTCREVIPPQLSLVRVDEPNVMILEFDEPVFINHDGKPSIKGLIRYLDALSD